ncbi:hypothetical protein RFI_18253 [Reticulomyxa filosa]|uniref:Uncharacterized protein n=1 Tax=Reticulomyxa filosa TaxID=46433 RepID=X6MY93_RETFI|nr:hypothetical protein RFI_18253 [Reticulomyxa filosa]|eukprot:ETO18990.1 hypothetical protein RFI_18253 [Reticulomyxa filosa]
MVLFSYAHLIQQCRLEKQSHLKQRDIFASQLQASDFEVSGNFQGGVRPFLAALNQRLQTFDHLIANCDKKMARHLDQVLNSLPMLKKKQLHQDDCKWSFYLTHLQLTCALLVHGDDFQQCSSIFERLVSEGNLQIWINSEVNAHANENENEKPKNWILNFRGVSLLNIRFILRYLFTCSKEDLCDIIENGKKDLVILCNINSKTIAFIKNTDNNNSLKQFIIDELQSWTPPLIASVQQSTPTDSADSLTLAIDSASIAKFFEQNGSCNTLSLLIDCADT